MAHAPLRFGILGAAQVVAYALVPPAQSVADAEIVAVAARDRKRAEEFAATHRIPRVLATYEQLIRDPDIDVIYNPLPNSLHCEWSIAAMRAGKHVLCEKPIASNASQAEQMATVARETGSLLGEAFHYRYHPLAERVRGIVRDGTLGRLTYLEGKFLVPISQPNIRFDWSLAGGATMDLGCYPLHMLREFSGLRPRVVNATPKIGPKNIDVAMEVDLELEGGVPARVNCSMVADAQVTIAFLIRGEKGELNIFNPVAPQMGNSLTLKTASGEKQETVAGDASYTCQLRAFAEAVRGNGEFPTDGDQGVFNMRVIDDVYRAAGLPVRGTDN